MKRFILPVSIFVVALASLATEAKADVVYNFSFVPTNGTVFGTVSGTVDLGFLSPGGSGKGSASSLVLTSIPAAYGVLAGGNTATSWAHQVADSFTVVNGTITGFEFFALTAGTDPSDLLCLNSTAAVPTFGSFSCLSDLNELHTNTGLFGYNFNGLAGVTFTAGTSAMPEPNTIALFGFGALGLAGLIRRTR